MHVRVLASHCPLDTVSSLKAKLTASKPPSYGRQPSQCACIHIELTHLQGCSPTLCMPMTRRVVPMMCSCPVAT